MMYEKKTLPHLAYLKNLMKYTLEYYEFYSSEQAKKHYIHRDCCGSFRVDEYYYEKFQPRNNFMLIAVESGQIYFETPGESDRQVAGEGEIILIDCYKPQHYGALCDSYFYYLHINGPAAEQFLSALTEIGRHVCQKSPAVTALYELIVKSVLDCRANLQTKENAFSGNIYTCLCNLFDEYNPCDADNYINVSNQFVKAAIEYMKQNYSRKIELTEIADSLNISVTYLSHIFKSHTNKSPYRYLTEYRLSAAKYMLANQNALVKEIAYSCGFSSEANFIYAFRKFNGISPGAYREKFTKVPEPAHPGVQIP